MDVEQLNVEYFFRLLYDCLTGSCSVASFAQLSAIIAAIWLWIVWIGYIIAFIGLVAIAYFLFQLFELRKREEEELKPIILAPDEVPPVNPKWAHIDSLMESMNENDWRQAIIEADIMLGEILTVQGYGGPSIGDQLQQLSREDLHSLDQAWEAHRVRNDIAHQGASFALSPTSARRTIAQYETVFREFGAI